MPILWYFVIIRQNRQIQALYTYGNTKLERTRNGEPQAESPQETGEPMLSVELSKALWRLGPLQGVSRAGGGCTLCSEVLSFLSRALFMLPLPLARPTPNAVRLYSEDLHLWGFLCVPAETQR